MQALGVSTRAFVNAEKTFPLLSIRSCHSGDLLPTFGSAGYAFKLSPRDTGDVTWTALQMDQWSYFGRHGVPQPSAKYLSTRGYSNTAAALARSGGRWTTVLSGGAAGQIMSLGPAQKMVPLAQNGAQCKALGLPIDYISQGL